MRVQSVFVIVSMALGVCLTTGEVVSVAKAQGGDPVRGEKLFDTGYASFSCYEARHQGPSVQ